jgi:hypothetical protein
MSSLSGLIIAVSLFGLGYAEKEAECSVGADGTCEEPVHTAPVLQCGTYMGPSTLGEDTNMGIYAGMDLEPEQPVNFPEIAIPLLFRDWGEHKPGYTDGELWDRYIWEGVVADLDPYKDENREASRAVFVPGVGCTVNSVME